MQRIDREKKRKKLPKKFKNKYRIESVRLKNYDYSQNGAYFVTIVTKNRKHYFGEIQNGNMILNKIGRIAQKYWDEIPQHFHFIKLDEMVIMPDHIHGILWIDNDCTNVACNISSGVASNVSNGVASNISSGVASNISTTTTKNEKMAKISPKRGSLASVIRSLKSAVTKKSREINPIFAWQPRFHDRIVRDENGLNRIRQYIISNPEKWERDKNDK